MLRTSGGNAKKPCSVVDWKTHPLVMSIGSQGFGSLSTVSKGVDPLRAASMNEKVAVDAGKVGDELEVEDRLKVRDELEVGDELEVEAELKVGDELERKKQRGNRGR